MQFYGKSRDTATQILELFRTGNVPAALAPIFVRRHDDTPCRRWSWGNQLLTALAGTADARGFRQWEEVGRKVSKGTKAFQILGPVTKAFTDRDEDGQERKRTALVGFKSIPVHRIEDTHVIDPEKWDRANKAAETERAWVDSLPLVDVARAWGLSVDTYNGAGARAYGWYRHGSAIALGDRRLSTWAHELTHAADDRQGTINKRSGQQLDNEVVAEFGAALLLTILGDETAANYGGAWEYIGSYARKHKREPVSVCIALLERTCNAIDLILRTAQELATAAPAETATAAA